MKKVLAIVLSLSMVLGSFGMAFAATPAASKFSDVNGLDCEEAVKVLTDLSVVTGYDDGTYKPENIVTRAEMAVLVVNALGLQNYVTENARSTFTDMSGYGWAEGYVAYAQSLGIISGYGDGTFQPGKTVSYDEAATMLVAALGYTPASLQGSWPANYVTRAQSLGILDGIVAGAAGANRGDIAVMLYQTIDQLIGTVNSDNQWVANQGNTQNNLGDRMIVRLGADDRNTGVVTGNEDSNLNLRPYVGAYATMYVRNNTVIAVTDVESEFLSGDFDSLTTFSGDDDVDYRINDSVNSVYSFLNGDVIDAGVSMGGIDSRVSTQGAIISAEVSGRNITRIYAVMAWEEVSAAKVTAEDLRDIEDDQELLGSSFSTLRDGSIDLNSFELLGVNSLSDIAADNIVAVYTEGGNRTNDITRVEVGTEIVRGEVTRVRERGSDPLDDEYTVGGKIYSQSGLMDAVSMRGDVEAGDDVVFYLDYSGDVYDVEANSDSGNYAIITYQADAKNNRGDMEMDLLTPDGTDSTFDIDMDAWADGDIQLTGNAIGASNVNIATGVAITDAAVVGALVEYETNRNGKIDSLSLVSGYLSGRMSSDRTVFAGREIANSIVVYAADTVSGTNADWDVYSLDSVKTGETINAWYIADNNGRIKALAISDTSNVGSSDNFGLISSYSSTNNADGDRVYELDAVVNGRRVTALTDDRSNGFTATDVFKRFDMDGDVFTGAVSANITTSATVLDDFGSDDMAAFVGSSSSNGAIAARPLEVTVNLNSETLAAYKVISKNGTRLEIVDTGNYESVSGATVIMPVFNDGDFDYWDIGTVGNIARDGYVILLQTDEDSSTWDTIIFIDRDDVDDFAAEFSWI